MNLNNEDVITMNDKNIFDEIKEIYESKITQEKFENVKTYYKQNIANEDLLKSLINDVKSKSVKKIICNKEYQNVLLYENELRTGNKPNGKIIKEEKKECYIYYYDKLERVILIEQLEEFNGILVPYYINVYLYENNSIYHIYVADYRNAILRKYELDNDRIKECYTYKEASLYTDELKEFVKYIYVNQKLSECLFARNNKNEIISSYKSCIYNDENELIKIIRYCDNGYNDVSYSCEKIDYKKLENKITNELKNIVYPLLSNNEIKTLAFNCCVEEGMLEIYGSDNENVDYDNIYEWKYNDLENIELIRYPLADSEYEKILLTCAKAINNLASSDGFKEKSNSLVCLFYNHSTNSYIEIPDKIKKMLSINKCFKLK